MVYDALALIADDCRAFVIEEVPEVWMKKYQEVKAAGLIPNVPVPKLDAGAGLPVYPAGAQGDACNWEVSQCFLQDSLRFAPEGTVVLTADDGPTDAVKSLIPALTKHNLSMTHFLIGSQIVWCPECLQQLAETKPQQHFGSHSFTHVQLATFTDEQVVADLGWTNQLIYDYTGYVPLYWRAPQGDIDKRVSAIAKYVFGLQHVFWTNDANDWCILEDGSTFQGADCKGKTPATLAAQYKTWADSSPQTGMVVLSHELRKSEVLPLDGFFESLIAKKWKMGGVPILGLPWYNNAAQQGEKGLEGKDIIPTSKPFEVSEGGHKVELGGWSPGIGGQTGANSSSTANHGGSTGSSSNNNTTSSTGMTGSHTGTSSTSSTGGTATSSTSSQKPHGTSSTSAAAGKAESITWRPTSLAVDVVSLIALLWFFFA